MASVFWDAYGIISINYLGRTINSEYYKALLERLNDEIEKKRPYLKKTIKIKTMAPLHEFGYKLFPHPPYSPDLAPSDFFLFVDLKRMIAGKKFSSNKELIAETEAYKKYRPGRDLC
jgi:[histone H3]-lysine36 N-dimethyltransferase SETMAR